MNTLIRVAGIALLLAPVVASGASARNVDRDDRADPRARIDPGSARSFDSRWDLQPYGPVAVRDTTVLASFTFNPHGVCDSEGWIGVDLWAQEGDYFHVDDFDGLGAGDFGRLLPLEGNQSLWCGARPAAGDPVLCQYAVLPGYGNDWLQGFCTNVCFPVIGDMTVDYLVSWDSEPGYDYTYLQFDNCDDDWQTLVTYNEVGKKQESVTVPTALHSGSVRVRFLFESDGAWSDKDGLWNTDGALILDSLTVSDAGGVVLPTELFEGETPGDHATVSGNWVSRPAQGYGDFAALYPGSALVQEDLCNFNISCVWAFINGSTYNYSCGGWPNQKAVPYGNRSEQYIYNEVWSPLIPITGSGSGFVLSFDVYRDLNLSFLVYYGWKVRTLVDGCATGWMDDYGPFGYGNGKDWHTARIDVGQFVDPAATHLQVALVVRDYCIFWYGLYGTCGCHSHAPLFDNVYVHQYAALGPQWQVRDLDLFQDSFSGDGTITGTARADAANDILPRTSSAILPGDSVSVTVADPAAGLGYHNGDPSQGAAVYCYVDIDGPHGGVTDASLVDDSRYTHVGTVSAAGRTWAKIQLDSSYTATGSVVRDDYNIDLNDNLFVPGDTVWFFFGAENASSQATYFAFPVPTPTGETDDIELAAANADEFTILPAGGYQRGGDILYVDGMNFRGAQWAFDSSFDMMGILELVDRYDIRGPSSAVGNHPASRVTSVMQQLIPVYAGIIWNTGDLDHAFGDGSGTPADKSDDTGMLYTFLDNLMTMGGVYLNGDDVADAWLVDFISSSAAQLRTTFINFGVTNGDHRNVVDQISPWGIGMASGIFADGSGPDTLVAYAGCPSLNDFDVLQAMGTSVVQMEYQDTHSPALAAPAVLSQSTVNSQGQTVGFVLSGFSFHEVRDAYPGEPIARVEHLSRIGSWLFSLWIPATGVDVPGAINSLSQNRPNPFNPVTTIEYQVAEPGPVSLRVYNVAGKLVSVLVDGHRTAGTVHEVKWNGLNDAGGPVSSGVYFYKLVTDGYTATRKMVLLK